MADTKTALPTSNTSCHPHPTDSVQFTISLPSIVFINLTITTFTTMYRAQQHHDTTLLAFLAFVYASYFILHNCVQVYSRLPNGEKSAKKELLRFTLWFLPTLVLLGFAAEFGTFMNVTVVVLMYCLAIASSLTLFYVHYIYDDQKGHDQMSNSKHDHVPIAQNIV
ncbi:hypothetical protein RchiOBHm_Chr2g0169171 [Rosa chinensis]|uniref:Uncharacterized protein n=1 Tax=Rosa chinensis TaxID=74649 RepID=A0A2P6S4R7_ROSCH|nr:hypothetical protein RchiOBHm_Chr2g0169171 [Rosa chinensis]